MFKNYSVMFKNVEIGKIYETNRGLHYIPSDDADTLICYPLGLYSRKDLNHLNLLRGKPVGEDKIRRWLESRVFPKEREGSWTMLKHMGLNSYDTWDIAKSTRAVSFKDYYWLKVEDTDTFETVHPRAKEWEPYESSDEYNAPAKVFAGLRRGITVRLGDYDEVAICFSAANSVMDRSRHTFRKAILNIGPESKVLEELGIISAMRIREAAMKEITTAVRESTVIQAFRSLRREEA